MANEQNQRDQVPESVFHVLRILLETWNHLARRCDFAELRGIYDEQRNLQFPLFLFHNQPPNQNQGPPSNDGGESHSHQGLQNNNNINDRGSTNVNRGGRNDILQPENGGFEIRNALPPQRPGQSPRTPRSDSPSATPRRTPTNASSSATYSPLQQAVTLSSRVPHPFVPDEASVYSSSSLSPRPSPFISPEGDPQMDQSTLHHQAGPLQPKPLQPTPLQPTPLQPTPTPASSDSSRLTPTTVRSVAPAMQPTANQTRGQSSSLTPPSTDTQRPRTSPRQPRRPDYKEVDSDEDFE